VNDKKAYAARPLFDDARDVSDFSHYQREVTVLVMSLKVFSVFPYSLQTTSRRLCPARIIAEIYKINS
jgi:hypothetical protein